MTIDTALAGQNLRGADLRRSDLTRKALFRTDLTGANLHGTSISIDCATFDGVKLDDDQVAILLRLIALADISPVWIDGLKALVVQATSPTRAAAIDRYLRLHV